MWASVTSARNSQDAGDEGALARSTCLRLACAVQVDALGAQLPCLRCMPAAALSQAAPEAVSRISTAKAVSKSGHAIPGAQAGVVTMGGQAGREAGGLRVVGGRGHKEEAGDCGEEAGKGEKARWKEEYGRGK